MENKNIPVVIPAYKPDDRLLYLLDAMEEAGIGPVIIVNDGSGESYDEVFTKAAERLEVIGGCILAHGVNRGKGSALKTAFTYVLERYPNAWGVVTADSDGQHTIECIRKVMTALEQHRKFLVLGVRDFDSPGIPWRSRFGNKITVRMLRYVSGLNIQDTQTGLRGIPRDFMTILLNIRGERYEFETRMLLESVGKYPIYEVPVKTIYDSAENHQTHFNPLVDSVKIYGVIGKKFLVYAFVSLSSSFLDLLLFTLFCAVLKSRNANTYIAWSTVLARIISATYNYSLNYKAVFNSDESIGRSAVKYCVLAIAQMSCSAFFVTLFSRTLAICPVVIIKAVIDTLLFFASYKLQQKFVFSGKK